MSGEAIAAVCAGLAALLGAIFGFMRWLSPRLREPGEDDAKTVAAKLADCRALATAVGEKLEVLRDDLADTKTRISVLEAGRSQPREEA